MSRIKCKRCGNPMKITDIFTTCNLITTASYKCNTYILCQECADGIIGYLERKPETDHKSETNPWDSYEYGG